MPAEATIQIRSRDVRNEPLGSHHLFIVYNNSKGKETVIRGGPEYNNMLIDNLYISKACYTRAHIDYVEKAPSVTIAIGTNEEMHKYLNRIWNIANKINTANLDYKLPIFGCSASICHVQNSNTVIKVLVEKAGLEFKLPEINGIKVWAPGIDGVLKHTKLDKEISFWIDKLESKLSSGLGQCKKHDIDLNLEEDNKLDSDTTGFNWNETCPSVDENIVIEKTDNQYPDLFEILDMFSDPEVRDSTLTNSERFRLLAKKQDGGKYSELSGIFENLAAQTDLVLSFLGNSESLNKNEEEN